MRRLVMVLVAVSVLGIVGGGMQAHAVAYSLSFTTADWSGMSFPGVYTAPSGAPHTGLWDNFGYPGDHVAFLGDTGGLSLGTQTVQIGVIDWDIFYTYSDPDPDNGTESDWVTQTFNFNVPIDISFDVGPGGQVLLPGVLETQYENDFVQFADGVVSSFNAGGYVIDVKPLGIQKTWGSYFSGDPGWQQPYLPVYAEITVGESIVPEPATMAMMGLGLAGLVASRFRRVSK